MIGFDEDRGDCGAFLVEHEGEFVEWVRAAWLLDIVPAVKRWQAEVGGGRDADVVDLELNQDDVRSMFWTVHLRSGASRRFAFDLVPRCIH